MLSDFDTSGRIKEGYITDSGISRRGNMRLRRLSAGIHSGKGGQHPRNGLLKGAHYWALKNHSIQFIREISEHGLLHFVGQIKEMFFHRHSLASQHWEDHWIVLLSAGTCISTFGRCLDCVPRYSMCAERLCFHNLSQLPLPHQKQATRSASCSRSTKFQQPLRKQFPIHS